MHGNVAFVDCETTGLDPDQHEIWEVGLIVPVVGTDAEGDGWAEHVWQLPVDLANVRLTNGLHLAGACVSFDADRLWRLMRRGGECPMWHYHLIDVEVLAAGLLAGRPSCDDSPPPAPPWRSTDLSRAVGVDPDDFDRHTALGDARWAKAIYEAVMGGQED